MKHAALVALTIDETTGRVSYVRLQEPDSDEGDDMDFGAENRGASRPLDQPRHCNRCLSQHCRKDGCCT